jgi:broad specificity phosphatase PhoE
VPLTLYVARHAEAANPKNILYGRLPGITLSATGRKQALELGEAMAELPLQAIYRSPLLRARLTAAAIAAHHAGVRLHRSSLLLEVRHPYQGRPHAEVSKLGDRAYDADVLGSEGETIQELVDRLARFLRQVQQRHPDGIIAAVGHCDPIAALRTHLLGKELKAASLREEAPPPAGVFRVNLYDDGTSELSWFWKPASPPQQSTSAAPSDGAGHDSPEVSAESADNLVSDSQPEMAVAAQS